MYVRAMVEVGVAENSFVVPQRAVTRNPKGEAVALVVGAENKVEERTLTVRNSIGNNWLVEKGITDGDRVIVEGLQLVRAGQTASPIEVTIDEVTGEVKERKESALEHPAVTEAANN
jgi:membrane fusion protein (multidrug efflux system)